jgi:hypothetical protein
MEVGFFLHLKLFLDGGRILLASGFGLPFIVTDFLGEGNLLLQFLSRLRYVCQIIPRRVIQLRMCKA